LAAESTERRDSKAGRIVYKYLLLALFIALGAVVAGKISYEARSAKEQSEETSRLIDQYTEELEELEAKVAETKAEVDLIENRYNTALSQLKETDREFFNLYDRYSRSLVQTRKLAGLTSVSGAGIVIRLDDSGIVEGSLVHDSYLTETVNVLKAAGAQAISINGERIVATSEMLCLGPSIRVNGSRLFAPYCIYAIGDADALLKAYQESRVYATIVAQGLIYDVSKSDNLVITGYNGNYYKQIAKLF